MQLISGGNGATLIAALILSVLPAFAQDWKLAFREAQLQEDQNKYILAVSAYQKALKLLPANAENDRAKTLLALAGSYARIKDYEATIKTGNAAVDIMLRLSDGKKLDPDVLLSAISLLDVLKNIPYDAGHKHDNVHRLQRDWTELIINIKMATNKKDPSVFSDAITNARTYVALNDDKTALKKLVGIQARLPAGSADYWPVRANIAGLENRHGDKRSTVILIEKLKRLKSPFETLMTVADGQFWAADYKQCAATLETARYLARKAKSAGMESRIEMALARSCTDRADGQGAKEHLNIANQLAQQANRGEPSTLPQYSKRPASQHKEYDSFLNDEEKAALKQRHMQGLK